MPYSIDSSSDHCYPGTSCLMNKFDIHDAQKLDELESSIVYGKLALLQHIPIPGSFDFAHYKRIHQFLFCDLYDWAGQIRDVDLFKKGTAFVPASDIERCADALFGRLQAFRPENLSRREIIENIADFYNTLNMLHPFREGNGRTQRVFFTQWVTQKLGFDLLWRQDLYFVLRDFGRNAVICRVSDNQPFFDCAVEGIVQHRVDAADRVRSAFSAEYLRCAV